MRMSTGRICRAAPALLALAGLVGCATTGSGETAAPGPEEVRRGWQVFVYAADGTVVGRTSLAQHPADRTRPDAVLASLPGAFCLPVLDDENEVADERLRKFCRGGDIREGSARVVLAPGWGDEVPPHSACFIHCVCEGYVARGDDPAELARESERGGCSNRLNCRLDCPSE